MWQERYIHQRQYATDLNRSLDATAISGAAQKLRKRVTAERLAVFHDKLRPELSVQVRVLSPGTA